MTAASPSHASDPASHAASGLPPGPASRAASDSARGYGLYFIDVLACLLFSITLALAGAHFGRERSVPVDLPQLAPNTSSGSDLAGTPIVLRAAGDGYELFLGEEPVSFEELERRLRENPPPSVVVRSEESALARVIAAAHSAGVLDIQLAYEATSGNGRTAP